MSSVFGRCFDISPAEYQRAAEVTYLGSVYGTLAALRRMLPRSPSTTKAEVISVRSGAISGLAWVPSRTEPEGCSRRNLTLPGPSLTPSLG